MKSRSAGNFLGHPDDHVTNHAMSAKSRPTRISVQIYSPSRSVIVHHVLIIRIYIICLFLRPSLASFDLEQTVLLAIVRPTGAPSLHPLPALRIADVDGRNDLVYVERTTKHGQLSETAVLAVWDPETGCS